LTTIAKVIFTPFKKILKGKECPVDLAPYFQICEYSKNHRTLLDFELPFLYVEMMDRVRPGVLEQFRNYLNSKEYEIIMAARQAYEHTNSSRLNTFRNYLNRIYNAYNSGYDCSGRMQILYNNISNPKIEQRLCGLKERLADKIAKLVPA
jgi:hypothetical protein